MRHPRSRRLPRDLAAGDLRQRRHRRLGDRRQPRRRRRARRDPRVRRAQRRAAVVVRSAAGLRRAPGGRRVGPRPGADTGAGNAWGVMSVDAEHGLVLMPTGSASPDFYGGLRAGSNRFADSLLALDAATGKLAWQQQLVHHDLWDYDLAAQPVLGDIERAGRAGAGGHPGDQDRHAVRRSSAPRGRRCFRSSRSPCPPAASPGEQAAPTQPFSIAAGARVAERRSTRRTPGASPSGIAASAAT